MLLVIVMLVVRLFSFGWVSCYSVFWCCCSLCRCVLGSGVIFGCVCIDRLLCR